MRGASGRATIKELVELGIYRDGDTTIITCRRSQPSPPCKSCGKPASFLCDFALMGPMTGKTCSHAVCSSCAVPIYPGKHYCPAHARYMERQAAEDMRRMGQQKDDPAMANEGAARLRTLEEYS